RGRGRHRALADATLAGKEQEPPVEQSRRGRRAQLAPKPTLRPPASAAISTNAILSVGTPIRRPFVSFNHNTPPPSPTALSTALVTASTESSVSMASSRAV